MKKMYNILYFICSSLTIEFVLKKVVGGFYQAGKKEKRYHNVHFRLCEQLSVD